MNRPGGDLHVIYPDSLDSFTGCEDATLPEHLALCDIGIPWT